MEWYLAYLLLGAFVGFFAGLLGIGGGLVLVPVLSFLFEAQQLGGEQNLHLALGTSMAAILYTAASSAYTHYAHGAVNMSIVRGMTPGLLFGTLLGALFASHVSQFYLAVFFALFVYFAAAQMLLELKPKATRQLPGRAGLTLVGSTVYPDATQFGRKSRFFDPKATPEQPRWFNVDVQLVRKIPLIAIQELRRHPELARMRTLQRGNRLSITPLDPAEWQFILKNLVRD